jgi:hypothetical protein
MVGRGRYRPDPRSGAMHGSTLAREMFYGTDGERVYVRLDEATDADFLIEFEGGAAATEFAAAACSSCARLCRVADSAWWGSGAPFKSAHCRSMAGSNCLIRKD